MAQEQEIQLDHVVLLVPYEYLANPPSWITKNFVVSRGGQHADGKTENRLVLFRDGTYLELIAFINDDPEKRNGHFWDKPYGIVDYALTTPKPYDFEDLRARLKKSHTAVSYTDPTKGGRKRPDGVELQWEGTFPLGAERGEVPFWCHDITPRERRVPVTKESTDHPSGVTGMAAVTLQTGQSRARTLDSAISTITNDLEKTLVTPLSPAGAEKSRIQVETEAALRMDYRLSLVLRTSVDSPPAAIEESIGDGRVSITFEVAKM